ncbi:ferrous iron transport protein B [Christensenellaceae bacterium 44-20]
MIFALAGNQNCGKTTLFNQLTGSNQHVGNFPGVTVERKEGIVKKHPEMIVVDLPGIYSLSPYTSEEVVTRDFLLHEHPDAIINIIDATNIERNLYLTLQLLELNIPMVLALNMMDEVRANHGSIDLGKFSAELGIPCVPISASKNEGIEDLVSAAIAAGEKKRLPRRLDFCSGPVHKAIHALCHLIEDHAEASKIPVRFAATKLVEGDEPTIAALNINENELDIVDHIVREMESDLGTDRLAALADMRYSYIEELCEKTVVKAQQSREQLRSLKIDSLLTHRIWALPIFVAIMFGVFWITFGPIGIFFQDLLAEGVQLAIDGFESLLIYAEINPILQSLLIDGVCAGVGSVLSFLPVIIILFFLLSLLEDSGYMARIAFIMDKPLRRLGLSGRSFVPMLVGFGCSVPAILSTRTLSSDRDRKMTILLVPFMSCSAKLPIYAMFAAAFFPGYAALVTIGLYIFGILAGIIAALILKGTKFRGNPVPFVMELPSYRLPSAKSVTLHMWEKAKDFLKKAFTVILLATVIIWVLQSFDFRFNYVQDSEVSMLGSIGKLIAPIFAPLGFADWRAASALITGFSAKEAVVSTLSILTGSSLETLPAVLSGMFSPLSALSFLVFTLLYTPCVAAVGAMNQELGKRSSTLGVVITQCAVAWLAAFLVYTIGLILGF